MHVTRKRPGYGESNARKNEGKFLSISRPRYEIRIIVLHDTFFFGRFIAPIT